MTIRGERGIQGVQGIQGEPGRVARRVVYAFAAVVLVSTILIGVLFNQQNDINRLTHQNQGAIRRLSLLESETQTFRIKRAKQTSATDRLICLQLNKVKAVIRDVVVPRRADLMKIAYYRDRPEEIQLAIDEGHTVAARFPPINCAKLPSSRAPVVKPSKS